MPWHSKGSALPSRHLRCSSSRNGKPPPGFRRRRHCLPFFISCHRTRQARCRAKEVSMPNGFPAALPEPGRLNRQVAWFIPPNRGSATMEWIAPHHFCPGDRMKSLSKSEFRPSARPRCCLNICAQRGTPNLPPRACDSTTRRLRLPFRPLLMPRHRGSPWRRRRRLGFRRVSVCWRSLRRLFIGGCKEG